MTIAGGPMSPAERANRREKAILSAGEKVAEAHKKWQFCHDSRMKTQELLNKLVNEQHEADVALQNAQRELHRVIEAKP